MFHKSTQKEFVMAKAAKCCTSTATCEKTIDFKFYAPQAKKVELGGCFNNWKSDKNPLKKDATGNWKTSLKLKAGRYQYRYLVDGVWQNAQEPVECVPNGFGSWNCVLEVTK
jgi:1,4-alpha-glucan branching enzyme